MIVSSDQVKKQLYEQNRDYRGHNVWNEAYGSAVQSAQQQMTAAGTAFGESVGEAYRSAQANVGTIAGSSLSEAGRKSLYESNQAAIEEAYNKSLSNYSQTAKGVSENLSKSLQNIDAAATTEAENMMKYRQAYLDYYNYLASLNDDTADGGISSVYGGRSDFALYGGAFREGDEEASRDELLSSLYETDPETGESRMTARGRAFFQMVEAISAENSGTGRSFDDWLARTDKDLYEWAASSNPYDYASGTPAIAGTHGASAQKMLGLEGYDPGSYKYSGGYNESLSDTERVNTVTKLSTDSTNYMKEGGQDDDNTSKLRRDVDLIVDNKANMSTEEYNAALAKNGVYVLDSSQYYAQGLGSGKNNDDIDITIGGNLRDVNDEFDLKIESGTEYIVKNQDYINTFNKLTTGDSSTTPNKGTLLVYADNMYIYTDKYGWRKVGPDNDPQAYKKAIERIKSGDIRTDYKKRADSERNVMNSVKRIGEWEKANPNATKEDKITYLKENYPDLYKMLTEK